ncbi:DUF2946 family protein [Rhodoferax saidenbachensis]|uniref:DUF2946 domain-containing protein n=1 Tax=Rhodoferax saidenbachensis TaxID=1484693 RepID=A0A1P8K624_9BURK|nr:DUF2946 family protein [Rhodoferax saidenbachensis]APW41460.1 DUF2946 domain-containing protein [Rhodoferax saidenbachensis]
MPALQTLRNARTLALGVLAWFVLSMGVAIASPVVKPQTLTLVCSTAGAVKLVAGSDDGATPAAHQTLDCVLCLALGAPPAVQLLVSTPVHGVVVPTPVQSAAVVWRTAAPLPARGPPAA